MRFSRDAQPSPDIDNVYRDFVISRTRGWFIELFGDKQVLILEYARNIRETRI